MKFEIRNLSILGVLAVLLSGCAVLEFAADTVIFVDELFEPAPEPQRYIVVEDGDALKLEEVE